MNNGHSDIGDNEIRIISSHGYEPPRRNRRQLYLFLLIGAVILMAGVVVMLFSSDNESGIETVFTETSAPPVPSVQQQATDKPAQAKGFTVRRDTMANGVELSILTPEKATPVLEIGNGVLDDTTAVLVASAADLRGDNNEIVGAYVVKGELRSKGEAKAGFCSIINGKITVGVADATPMLEKALMSDGYFFRQYPLVVGGQIVENKPKGRAFRKALAEIDRKTSVIISRQRLTFHDFSQALIDIGVLNAIYLVGANSYCSYRDAEGNMFSSGAILDKEGGNANFIVWR